MRKRISVLFAALMLLCVLAACSSSKVVKATDGGAEGRIGTTFGTCFFEFTVKSADFVEEYAGEKPQEGMQFVDVVISTKNTFNDKIEMYDDDYQIQWGKGNDDFGYPIEAVNDSMAPDTYELGRAEEKEFHYVYEVPEGSSEFSISYLEYFEDNTEGDVFFAFFELNPSKTI